MLALGQRGNDQAGLTQHGQVIDIGLVPVAVPLGDHVAVDLVGDGVFGHVRALRAQAHGAAQVGILVAGLDAAVGVFPLGDQRDDRVGAVGLEFGAVGIRQTGHMAGEFDGGHLHTQANAQVRHPVLAGKTGRLDLALNAPLAKAAGNQDRVVLGQLLHRVSVQRLGIDISNPDLDMVFHAGVAQRLVERLVAVGQIHIFADHGDLHLALWMLGLVDQIVPALQVSRRRVQAQLVANQAV